MKFRTSVPLVAASVILLLTLSWILPREADQSPGTTSPLPATARPAAVRAAVDDAGRNMTRNGDRNAPRAATALIEAFRRAGKGPGSAQELDPVRRAEPGADVTFRLRGVAMQGRLDSRSISGNIRHFGVTLAEGAGRMVFTVRDGRSLSGHVFFEGSERALKLSGNLNNGEQWTVEESRYSELVCSPPGTPYSAAPLSLDGGLREPSGSTSEPGSALTAAAPPILNSRPAAGHVIYLDFDGEVLTHPYWNGGNTINALPHPNQNNVAWVSRVWERASEDWAPFDINVSTDRAVYDAAAPGQRMHVIITPTNTAAPGSGGVAYLESYPSDIPCWVFNQSEFSCADTISHEVGHTVGLFHDGRNLAGGGKDSYFGGHGSGVTGWAPIMGAAWSDEDGPRVYDNVTQWSRGEYDLADNPEDDLALITRPQNGFGYRNDDHGDFPAAAGDLGFSGAGILDSGVIERTGDADWFRFATTGGSAELRADPLDVMSTFNEGGSDTNGANLAIDLQLFDGNGAFIEQANPADALGAQINRNLSAGIYYLRVAGAGRGTASTGFTDYASLGQYTLTGSVPITAGPPEIAVSGNGTAINSGDSVPDSLDGTDFGPAAVTGVTVDRTFVIVNGGGTPLTISSISENSSQFSILAGAPASIPGFGSAPFTVRFDPTSTGIKTATVTIASNDTDEASFTFAIEGEGTGGNADDSYEQNDTLATAYDLSLDEQVFLSSISGPGIQSDDDWYRIEVTEGFTRVLVEADFVHAAGDIDISLHDATGKFLTASSGISDDEAIDYNTGSGGIYYIRVYYGNGGNSYNLVWDDIEPATDPEIEVKGGSGFDVFLADGETSPTSASGTDFGLTSIGSGPAGRQFRIDNVGTAPLSISSISTGPGEFSILNGGATSIPSGGSLFFTVRYEPAASGIDTGTVTIGNGDADENPFTFAIRGEGIAAPTDDNYEENDSRPAAYDLANLEQTFLSNISGPGIQSDDDWYRIEVTPGFNRVLVDLTFTHSEGDVDITLHDAAGNTLGYATGVQDDEHLDVIVDPAGGIHYLRVYYQDAGNAYDLWWDDVQPGQPQIAVEGGATLATPIAAGDASPSLAEGTDFLNAGVSGGYVDQVFEINNAGGSPLSIYNISTDSADYTVLPGAPSSVIAGGSATFTVRFDPSATGLRPATVNIVSNAANQGVYGFAVIGIGLSSGGSSTVVTTLTDENNGSTNPTLGTGTSVREAVLHSPAGTLITVAPSLGGQTAVISSGQILVSKSLAFDASAAPGGILLASSGSSRHFEVQTGVTFTIAGISFSNGGNIGDGAAIRNVGTLVAANCTFNGNNAGDEGGAIYNLGTASFDACSFTSNDATSDGGAIGNLGDLDLTACTFTGNSADSGGGAIFNDGGTMNLEACVLSGNHSSGGSSGGAIDNDNDGIITIQRSTFSANTANFNAGAIDNDGTLTVTDSTFSNNTAATGGGAIQHIAGTLTMTSCTLSGNTANFGGAIDGDNSSTINLISCTLAGNHANSDGGGIEETSGTLRLTNTIIAGNTSPTGPDLKASSINLQGGVNLLSSTSGLGGSFSGIVAAPNLAALGNYGGPTATRPPNPGSPAIDAGGSTALPFDQRGLPRVFGTAVDIGAVEFQPFSYVVTSLADSGAGSLRDMVALAPAGSTITFDPALDNQSVVLASTVVIGKNLTLDASDRVGLEISGGDSVRLFQIQPGNVVTLTGLSLRDGASTEGGGVYNAGTLALEDCTFTSCHADEGGAVFNAGTGILTLTGCELVSNHASNAGGAVRNEGSLIMSSTLIASNEVDENASGGGVSSSGIFTATDCVFRANFSYLVDGAIASGGNLTLTRCIVENNGAADSCGGISVFGSGGVITACTISGNDSGGTGGGIYHGGGTLSLVQCTLADNRADYDYGGGIFTAGVLSVTSCTIAGNDAAFEGGGIYIESPGQLTLAHSVVAGNRAYDSGPDILGAIHLQTGVNLVTDTEGMTSTFTGIVGEPGLAPLGSIGGPTATRHPLPGSPLIDAGGSTALATDQRGFPRVAGAAVDIGAVEFQAPLLVTTSTDSGAGSLRDTIDAATAGSVIGFAPSLEGQTINLGLGTIDLDKGLVLDATTRRRLSISGLNEGRHFQVHGGHAVILAGLTLRNGTDDGSGGSIINQGMLALDRCVIEKNTSGAIRNLEEATLSVTGCQFLQNSGGDGGAITSTGILEIRGSVFERNTSDGSGGAIESSGPLTIADSIFVRNQAGFFAGAIRSSGRFTMERSTVEKNSSGDSGGGLYLSGEQNSLVACTLSGNDCAGSGGGICQAAGNLNLENCTLAANTAGADFGGGLFHSGSFATLSSCTLAGNHAAIIGGGLYNDSATLSLRNTILSGNTADLSAPDLAGAITSQSGVNLLGNTGGVIGTFTGIVGDPLLLPLGIHGGPTLTMPPGPGSPAIDAGAGNFLAADQRGLPRIAGAAVDIGAVESGNAVPTVIVNTLADENNGLATGGISLREAITESAPGSTIGFAPALDGGMISLVSGQLLVTGPRIIDATSLPAGISLTTTADHRALEVGPGHHAGLRGITISGITTDDNGAAISNRGFLELTGCRLIENNGADGGGIHNSGELTATDCLIHDHEAWGDGGGVCNEGAIAFLRVTLTSNGTSNSGAGFYNSGSLDLTDCLVSGSSANIEGGGIFNTSSANVRLLRCTVSSNRSEGSSGGGVLNLGSLHASSCTFSGNEATFGVGAGIANVGSSASLTVEECTFSANENYDFEPGGGIFNGSTSFFSLRNSIVAGNVGNDLSPDIFGPITLESGVNLVGSTGGITGPFAGLVADARLAPLGNYGGLTPVMPPLPGSPVFEAAAGGPSTDQLGRARPNGPLPDIGAVEGVAFSLLDLADTDNDGIPDLLEPSFGATVGTDDSAADSDGDGSSDAEEIAAMTDPLDPSDSLRIAGFSPAPGFDPVTNPGFTVSFPTFPGLTYSIESDLTLDFAGPDHLMPVPPFQAPGYWVETGVVLRPGKDFIRVKLEAVQE